KSRKQVKNGTINGAVFYLMRCQCREIENPYRQCLFRRTPKAGERITHSHDCPIKRSGRGVYLKHACGDEPSPPPSPARQASWRRWKAQEPVPCNQTSLPP